MATLEIPVLTDLHCQSLVARSGYLLNQTEYDELLAALPPNENRSSETGARAYVRRLLRDASGNHVLMDETFRVHGLGENQEEELSHERTLSAAPHAAHLHITIALYSVSTDYREHREGESLLDAAWSWIAAKGSMEVDVSAFISVPISEYEPIVALDELAIGNLGVFSAVGSISLVKYQDEPRQSPLLYEVEYGQNDEMIELRVRFKSAFAGAPDDALKLSARARELASFALKSRTN